MGQPKALKSFSKKSDNDIGPFFTRVIMMMTGNLYFTTPSPTLPALQDALDQYLASLTEAATKAVGKAAIKNQNKAALNLLGRGLADYVNYTGKQDLAILQSSGFDVSSGESSTRTLGPIEEFLVKHGKNSGDIKLAIKALNARGAMFSYTKDPITASSIWTSNSCMELSCTISNLPVGDKLCFSAKVLGSYSQYLTSQPVSIIVV